MAGLPGAAKARELNRQLKLVAPSVGRAESRVSNSNNNKRASVSPPPRPARRSVSPPTGHPVQGPIGVGGAARAASVPRGAGPAPPSLAVPAAQNGHLKKDKDLSPALDELPFAVQARLRLLDQERQTHLATIAQLSAQLAEREVQLAQAAVRPISSPDAAGTPAKQLYGFDRQQSPFSPFHVDASRVSVAATPHPAPAPVPPEEFRAQLLSSEQRRVAAQKKVQQLTAQVAELREQLEASNQERDRAKSLLAKRVAQSDSITHSLAADRERERASWRLEREQLLQALRIKGQLVEVVAPPITQASTALSTIAEDAVATNHVTRSPDGSTGSSQGAATSQPALSDAPAVPPSPDARPPGRLLSIESRFSFAGDMRQRKVASQHRSTQTASVSTRSVRTQTHRASRASLSIQTEPEVKEAGVDAEVQTSLVSHSSFRTSPRTSGPMHHRLPSHIRAHSTVSVLSHAASVVSTVESDDEGGGSNPTGAPQPAGIQQLPRVSTIAEQDANIPPSRPSPVFLGRGVVQYSTTTLGTDSGHARVMRNVDELLTSPTSWESEEDRFGDEFEDHEQEFADGDQDPDHLSDPEMTLTSVGSAGDEPIDTYATARSDSIGTSSAHPLTLSPGMSAASPPNEHSLPALDDEVSPSITHAAAAASGSPSHAVATPNAVEMVSPAIASPPRAAYQTVSQVLGEVFKQDGSHVWYTQLGMTLLKRSRGFFTKWQPRFFRLCIETVPAPASVASSSAYQPQNLVRVSRVLFLYGKNDRSKIPADHVHPLVETTTIHLLDMGHYAGVFELDPKYPWREEERPFVLRPPTKDHDAAAALAQQWLDAVPAAMQLVGETLVDDTNTVNVVRATHFEDHTSEDGDAEEE